MRTEPLFSLTTREPCPLSEKARVGSVLCKALIGMPPVSPAMPAAKASASAQNRTVRQGARLRGRGCHSACEGYALLYARACSRGSVFSARSFVDVCGVSMFCCIGMNPFSFPIVFCVNRLLFLDAGSRIARRRLGYNVGNTGA